VELIATVEASQVDVVIVQNIDGLTRNLMFASRTG